MELMMKTQAEAMLRKQTIMLQKKVAAMETKL